MNWFHQIVSLGHDDGARLKNLTFTLPSLPYACKSKGLLICKANEIGLFCPVGFLLPFDKPITRDKTASGPESIPECRFFFDRFSAGVDGAVFSFGLL